MNAAMLGKPENLKRNRFSISNYELPLNFNMRRMHVEYLAHGVMASTSL